MNSAGSLILGAMNFVPHWALFVAYGVIVLLVSLFIAFKGFKRGVKFIISGLIIIVAAYLAYLVAQIAMWDVSEIITFAVSWGPTVLFVLIVMTATFIGAKRGLRKSLILALHAVCAGGLCLAFFFIMVNVREVDEGLLNFCNFFMGEGGLQRALGADESLTSLKEVLAAAIPSIIGAESDFGILLRDNTAYLYTLVDFAYRLVIGLLSAIFYFSLIFILYIIYHLCYSQRKYKRVKIAEFRNGNTDRNYSKRHIGGGVVGLVRGLAVGILSLSFLGSAFYMVAGGTGKESEDFDFGNDDINYYYRIYRSIEGYGSQGIFKILNMMTDAADTPYYLFAADLVFSGELNDGEAGVSGNIKFREEIAAYTGFARDTMELLMKYGADEIREIVGGEVTDNAFDTVVGVMTAEGFQAEFDALIDAFDAKTYIVNLTMSLINSVVANIDDVSFVSGVGDGEKELLKVLFKRGYLSSAIPDERALIESTGLNEASGNDVRPYITVNHLISKKDVKTVLNVVLSVLAGEETGDTLELVKRITPEIGKLTVLSSERKGEMNPVLGRLYCLCENQYLTLEGEDGITYSEIAGENIDWIGEINTLLGLASETVGLYEDLADRGEEALDTVFYLFDETGADYADNMRVYDKLCSSLSDSKVLGKVLSTGYLYRTIADGLAGIFPDIYVPRDITYNNVYDGGGNLKEYGETYKLFHGAKFLCNSGNREVLDKLQSAGGDGIGDALQTVADVINNIDTETGLSLAQYMTESALLRSVISVSLIGAAAQGNTFYVPQTALEEQDDGSKINLILKKELSVLLDNMDRLADFVIPFVGEDGGWEEKVDGILADETFNLLVRENRIFEGTVANVLNLKLQDDLLVIPKALKDDVANWLTVEGKQGEIINILDALDVSDFKVSDILAGNDGSFGSSEVLDKISDMSENDLEVFFNSVILHYTVSDYLINGENGVDGFNIVVPYNCRQRVAADDAETVKKSELISAFGAIATFGLTEGDDSSAILVKIAKNKSSVTDSKIISASLAAELAGDGNTALSLPDVLIEKGTVEELLRFDSTNPWSCEVGALLDAVDELFDLDEEGFVLDSDAINGAVSSVITSLNGASEVRPAESKLDVLYASLTVRGNMTEELDDALLQNGLLGEGLIRAIKFGDTAYKKSEFSALSDALNELGVNGFDGFGGLEFNSISNLTIIGGYVYGEGVTKSYIIAAAVSEELLKDENGLVVPVTATINLGGNILIKPQESRLVIDTFALVEEEYGITDVGGWQNVNIRIPKGDLREALFTSEIMRVKIVKQLAENSGAGLLAVRSANGSSVKTVNGSGNCALINKIQLDALADALEIMGGDGQLLTAPTFTSVNDLRTYTESDLEILFNSDIIRYRICKLLADSGFEERIPFTNERAFDVTTQTVQTVKSAVAAQVYAALNG